MGRNERGNGWVIDCKIYDIKYTRSIHASENLTLLPLHCGTRPARAINGMSHMTNSHSALVRGSSNPIINRIVRERSSLIEPFTRYSYGYPWPEFRRSGIET